VNEAPQTKSFNPQRLQVARERRGLSIIDLARRIGVSARQISNYEHGTSEPSTAALDAIIRELRFPPAFFFGNPLVPLTGTNATFRSLRRTTAAQRNQVLAVGAIAMELNRSIEHQFNLPAVDLPDLSDYIGQPEAAAASLRSLWGLGERGIPNTIALLEVHGVRVFSLVEDLREVNAFSVWVEDRPFVFLNTTKSAEASRFDAMHELGHLVLHRQNGDVREMEAEANAFASAMLIPRDDVLSTAPVLVTLAGLIKLKRRWGVSVSALAHRLHDLRIIGPWPYRSLCVQINQNGYRTQEPNPMDREFSRVLAKVFAEFRKDRISVSDIAAELAVPREEIERLVFGLAMVGLEGGEKSASTKRTILHAVE
jgi:Zn-dependent peptidase ImmA (M78 family)/DNA-binding XRE family transcriptional regulator